jgi:hypothetical protein
MQNLPDNNKSIIEPDKLNYDLPMEYVRIFSDESNHIVAGARILINWIDIQSVEEYPKEWEDSFDWRQYREHDKTYLNTHAGHHFVVLVKYEHIAPLWNYYCKNVKKVDHYQYSNMIRTRNK